MCRWVCDKNGLVDVRKKKVNVNGIDATEGAKSS